jgi:hypothetical protein
MMQKEILEYKIKRYYDLFREDEPYLTLFLMKDNLAQIEEATKAVEWCIKNKKIIRFYPEAEKVLRKGYIPTEKMWDIL